MPCSPRVARAILFTLILLAPVPGNASAEVWRRPLWVEHGLPVVEVWVGNRGPYRFLVDTGAEGTTISKELAATLALSILGAVDQHTVNGVTRLPLVLMSDLRLGASGPVAADRQAAVSDLRGPRGVIRDLDGVLGGDVLGAYDYVLDYTARRLALARGETLPLRGGVTLPLRLDRQRPLVSWPRTAAARTVPLLLVLDSGADSLIVDAAVSDFQCRRRTSQTATLETHAGRRDVQTCELESLRAGDVSVEGLRLVAMDWPTTIARLEQGLLPASAFGRVYVASSRGTVTFWAR